MHPASAFSILSVFNSRGGFYHNAAPVHVVRRACETLEWPEASERHRHSDADDERQQSDNETKNKASDSCIHIVLPFNQHRCATERAG